MGETTRYALYYTPAPGSAFEAFGNGVLGYDSLSGREVASPAGLDGVEAITSAARVYGFHGTLRSPMRLATGATEVDLLATCEALAAHRKPFAAGPLTLTCLGDFLALVPVSAPAELALLAAECVATLEPLRAPLTPAERARRQPEALDARQCALLDRWGYPHVFESFRFHMTLSGRLTEPDRSLWRERLVAACPDRLDLVVDALTLLRQDGADPFRVVRRIPFEEEIRHGA